MYTRENIEFKIDDVTFKGWFYTPSNLKSPTPCIIMSHGFSALKEHGLNQFATHFAKSGMCVLVYDNRNFGESGGNPRLEVDPVAQIQDMRNIITFVQKLKNINSQKIGLWGTSFSGGIVLAVAALDKRVSCIVSQVPFISGHHKMLKLNKPKQWESISQQYNVDRRARLAGQPPMMVPVVTDNSEKSAIMKTSSAFSFFTSVPNWINQVTLRSVENSGNFEPINYIKRISPTPILFIVGNKDTINATDLALQAYESALEPKKLVLFPGDHFDPYDKEFNICSTSACEWFEIHLLNKTLNNDMNSNQLSITARL